MTLDLHSRTNVTFLVLVELLLFWPMTLGRLLSNLVNVSRTNVTTYMGSQTNDTPIISRTSSESN